MPEDKKTKTEFGEIILHEIRELKSWLYGANGFEGDVPQIKQQAKELRKRIRRIEMILALIIGSGILGTGIWSLLVR